MCKYHSVIMQHIRPAGIFLLHFYAVLSFFEHSLVTAVGGVALVVVFTSVVATGVESEQKCLQP